jgi:hypothetical protein
MAKKKLTPAQIVAVIQASGGDIGSTGLSQKQILSAFLSSPNLIKQFQETAGEAVSPYQQFDPTHVYNPTEVANSVQLKYMQMGAKYQPLVKDYWENIAKDTSPAGVALTKSTFRKNIAAAPQVYGLSEEEVNSILTPMEQDTEIESFRKTEATRQKSQFSAFNEQKKKLGIKSSDTAGEDYLKKITGLAGLGSDDNADFVASKQKEYLKLMKSKGVTDQNALDFYGKNFNTSLLAGLKKSKKASSAISTRALLKKNLGNL